MRLSPLLCVLMMPSSATALRDAPIVGSTPPFQLDGADWTATGVTRDFGGNCTFVDGVDFSPPAGAPPSVVATPVAYNGAMEQCCQLCGASANCAASVWDTKHGSCTLKKPEDLAQKCVVRACEWVHLAQKCVVGGIKLDGILVCACAWSRLRCLQLSRQRRTRRSEGSLHPFVACTRSNTSAHPE
jgi:hypothetical protein